MKESIYLVVSRRKVERMSKNLPSLHRGEIPIKINLEVDEKAFREPVIAKDVYIEDWQEGTDISDVEFKGSVITQEEVELIRERRLAKMKEVLESQGYTITKPEEQE